MLLSKVNMYIRVTIIQAFLIHEMNIVIMSGLAVVITVLDVMQNISVQ